MAGIINIGEEMNLTKYTIAVEGEKKNTKVDFLKSQQNLQVFWVDFRRGWRWAGEMAKALAVQVEGPVSRSQNHLKR